jgi:homoserine O-acetyltransferase
VGLTGLGIEGDLLYGPAQVRTFVDEAAAAGVDARYRELASIKGHDAFLTEWDQLTDILSEVVADGIARAARRGLRAVHGGRVGAA